MNRNIDMSMNISEYNFYYIIELANRPAAWLTGRRAETVSIFGFDV